jgi:hypothetical protein
LANCVKLIDFKGAKMKDMICENVDGCDCESIALGFCWGVLCTVVVVILIFLMWPKNDIDVPDGTGQKYFEEQKGRMIIILGYNPDCEGNHAYGSYKDELDPEDWQEWRIITYKTFEDAVAERNRILKNADCLWKWDYEEERKEE